MREGGREAYKRLKQWLEIDNFSGKSALSVKQDFYAKILAHNLTALMAIAAQKTVTKNMRKYRRSYRINQVQPLSKMKHRLVLFIRAAADQIQPLIQQTIDYLARTYEAVRDGRHYPRKRSNIKKKRRYHAYKKAL